MAVAGAKRQTIDFFQFSDLCECFFGEGGLPLKGVKYESFEQIADGKIFEFRQGLQHFQEPFLDPDSSLYPFYFDHRRSSSRNRDVTNVHWNIATRPSARRSNSAVIKCLRSASAYVRPAQLRWWRDSIQDHNAAIKRRKSHGHGTTRKRHQAAGCQIRQAGGVAQSGRAPIDQESRRETTVRCKRSTSKSARQSSGQRGGQRGGQSGEQSAEDESASLAGRGPRNLVGEQAGCTREQRQSNTDPEPFSGATRRAIRRVPAFGGDGGPRLEDGGVDPVAQFGDFRAQVIGQPAQQLFHGA